MSNLTNEELEGMAQITNNLLKDICKFSDAHNIDRDSALKYFANMISAFADVTTIEHFNAK